MGKKNKRTKGHVKMYGASIKLVETGKFLHGELKRKPKPTEKNGDHHG